MLERLPEDEELIVSEVISQIESTETLDESFVGVIYGKSVRSQFCSVHMALNTDTMDTYEAAKLADDEYEPVMVRLQFDDRKELRPFCRRFLKLGDLIEIKGFTLLDASESTKQRFLVPLTSIECAQKKIVVKKDRFWTVTRYQSWQRKYLPKLKSDKPTSNQQNSCCLDKTKLLHSGGLEKRQQGILLANFLVNMMLSKTLQHDEFAPPHKWAELDTKTFTQEYPHLVEQRQRVIENLSRDGGVIDAAGGSGHVSMALGLMNIRSTVVDPRESVGKLPGRDRKVWNRALRSMEVCRPIKEYSSFRAWFGSAPPQVRSDDQLCLPVCSTSSPLLQTATALVALHPDEATDSVVDIALTLNIPFVIVPCCVFARYFPTRKLQNADGTTRLVSTHEDLLEYLQSKSLSKSIKRSKLPFVGANTVLWS